jgi:cell division protein FtsX
VSVIQQINVYIVELPPQADARAVARKLKENPHIESVEVDERLPPAHP